MTKATEMNKNQIAPIFVIFIIYLIFVNYSRVSLSILKFPVCIKHQLWGKISIYD